jgi:hypothetical protein
MPAGSAVPTINVDLAIRAVLSGYLQDPTILGLTTDLAILARSLDALPVYADIGGALLIRPSGEVLEVHSNQRWETQSEHELVTDPETRRVAYESCARRFPSLRAVAEQLSAGI